MFSTRNRFINKPQSRSLLNLGNTSRKPKILKKRSNFFENCFLINKPRFHLLFFLRAPNFPLRIVKCTLFIMIMDDIKVPFDGIIQ